MTKIHRLLLTIKENLNEKKDIYSLFRMGKSALTYIFYKVFKHWNTFSFLGEKYRYFYSTYNNTWINERAIEIPIVMNIVKKNQNKRILEVGNVLSNYFTFPHDIVDKYEIADGVVNEDIADFKSNIKYDLIVSVSTLEHVGYDEESKDDTKIIRVIENLKGLVKPNGGMIVITVPLGYNPNLDKLLRDKIIPFDRQCYLIKISDNNTWKEATSEEIRDIKYGSPLRGTNGLVIGFVCG